MTRLVPVTVLVVVLAASRLAGAQGTGSGALPDGSTITFDKLYLHENGSTDLVEPKTPDSLWNYFNMAHCQCAKLAPADFKETTYGFLLHLNNPVTPNPNTLEIWVGTTCGGSDEDRRLTCKAITSQNINPISSISLSGKTIEVPLFEAMTPGMSETDCVPRIQDITTWAIAGDQSGVKNYFVSNVQHSDTQAPLLPRAFRAVGGDGAIDVSWTPPDDTTDTYAYQALCAVADTDAPALAAADRPTRRYQTGATLCGVGPNIDLGNGQDIPQQSGAPPAQAATLSADLKNLNPAFLCGDEFSATATSMRITGLTNGTAYKVVVLAVDKFQNPVGTFFTSTITPIPSTDFWEDLQAQGSNVEGGLCLLAETYGDDSSLTGALRAFRDDTLRGSSAGRWLSDAYYATLGRLGGLVHGSLIARGIAAVVLAPVVAFALLWHWLTLPGLLGVLALAWLWRRKALPRWLVRAAPAAIALVVLAPGRAHAGGYQPYWENSSLDDRDDAVAPDDPSLVKWQVGVRIGPYIPDIDKQLGKSPGPYKQMFGGYHILAMLDVDRVVWTSKFGQVTVGLSAGYLQKHARAFTMASTPGDGDDRARAADQNQFRLVPTALVGGYRFTWLDDEYGIPVVPYVRAGLSYYLWWITTADGSFAVACKDGTTTMGCDSTKGYGASLGVQGSIGLAIRAERIDAATAVSMRQSGIQHAGIYGELSIAKVDGFGSDSKLSVGDRTWFAGVNFEF